MRWLKRFFKKPNEEEGYQWAMDSLLHEKHTVAELEDLSSGSGFDRIPFDLGIQKALRDFERTKNEPSIKRRDDPVDNPMFAMWAEVHGLESARKAFGLYEEDPHT